MPIVKLNTLLKNWAGVTTGWARQQQIRGTRLAERLLRNRRAGGIGSPLCQLELDAAIATIGVLGRTAIDRLEFAEPCSHQPGWLDAFPHQVLYDRDCPLCRQIPIRLELPDDRPHIGMTVDAQYPGNFSGNLALQFDDRSRHLVEFAATLGFQIGPAGIEEYFRLQDETIPDDTDVRPVAEHL